MCPSYMGSDNPQPPRSAATRTAMSLARRADLPRVDDLYDARRHPGDEQPARRAVDAEGVRVLYRREPLHLSRCRIGHFVADHFVRTGRRHPQSVVFRVIGHPYGPPGCVTTATWCGVGRGSNMRIASPRVSAATICPVSALSSSISVGLRFATATMRVTESTTTPSGAMPTGTVRPGIGRVCGGADCGSAAGGRPSAGGRLPTVDTPGGRMPVDVGVAGADAGGCCTGAAAQEVSAT